MITGKAKHFHYRILGDIIKLILSNIEVNLEIYSKDNPDSIEDNAKLNYYHEIKEDFKFIEKILFLININGIDKKFKMQFSDFYIPKKIDDNYIKETHKIIMQICDLLQKHKRNCIK